MPRPANPQLAADILRVTAELVEEKGPEKVTLSEVAERLGYTRPAIYVYYRNKEDMLQATIDRCFEQFAEAQIAAEQGAPPATALRRRVAAYLDWGIEHPGMYRLMFEYPAEKPAEPDRAAVRRRWIERDRELLLQVFGMFPEGQRPELEMVASSLWGVAHGLVSLIISGRMFGQLGRAIGIDEAKARAQKIIEGTLVLPKDEEEE